MKYFIEGESCFQSAMLPGPPKDVVVRDNPVRVIDAFVEELDLNKLDFKSVILSVTGRLVYYPEILLNIYILGYLNRIYYFQKNRME